MLDALETYRENIARVKTLGGLNDALHSMITAALDLSDILRAQHVLAVSAFDYFVHETTRAGMMEIFDGKRPPTPAYARFRIPLDVLSAGAVISRSSFESEIRNQHGFLSFQHPDRVADAFRLIVDIKLWDTLAHQLNADPQHLKDVLKLIVDRRNKIAHEADVDPTYPKTRWPISKSDIVSTTDFLDQIVETLHQVVSLP